MGRRDEFVVLTYLLQILTDLLNTIKGAVSMIVDICIVLQHKTPNSLFLPVIPVQE